MYNAPNKCLRFRDGLEKILITTNVLSRGIDIEQVFLGKHLSAIDNIVGGVIVYLPAIR